MQKKYQIFVSSTFRDLIEERQAVLEAILELNHIPCGMEAFPANNSTPFELIKKMIDDSDYYVLIIGGRYGSLDEQGISYTELEYDYALETGKHILCFIHKNPDEIVKKNVDTKNALVKKLEKFKQKASKHIIKHWSNKFDLKSYVLSSLSIAFQLHPMSGWVKLKGEYERSFLFELNEIQRKYNELQEKYIALKEKSLLDDTKDIAKYNEKIQLKYFVGRYRSEEEKIEIEDIHKIEFTWLELLFYLSEVIIGVNDENDIIQKVSRAIFNLLQGTDQFNIICKKFSGSSKKFIDYKFTGDEFIITSKTFKLIKMQFIAFGWIDTFNMKRLETESYTNRQYEVVWDNWRLTPKGKRIVSDNIENINIS